MEERRDGLRVEAPASADHQTDRTIPAALNFLRDTKAGRMITLAPSEGEGEWEGLEAIELRPEEEGQGRPGLYIFFVYFFCSLPLSQISFAEKGGR